jgi:hypothetical protein
MVPGAEPSVAKTASKGDWLMATIGEDEGDGEDDSSEPQLSENDTISRDVSTCIAEGEYGGLESALSTVGVCVGIGSGTLMCHMPMSTGIPVTSVYGHVTDFGYIVKAVLMRCHYLSLLCQPPCTSSHIVFTDNSRSPLKVLPNSWLQPREGLIVMQILYLKSVMDELEH